jgi:hypothetical protein
MEVAPIFPRPKGFRPAGTVTSSSFAATPPKGLTGGRSTGVRKLGKAYERKVLKWLAAEVAAAIPDGTFYPSPWLTFQGLGGDRLCQPDAFLLTKRGGVVFEVKLRHSQMAYWQLRHLYSPVLAAIFPEIPIGICEVTKWFDPATPWPEPVKLLENPFDAIGTTSFGVFTWR